MKQTGMFPPPPLASPGLSERFHVGEYRARPGDTPLWSKLTGAVKPTCIECFQLQHELGGAGPNRSPAVNRRTLKSSGARLELCHTHTLAWKTLDDADLGRGVG